MSEGILAPQAICQVAIVVEDIEAASKAWATVLGVPVPAWHIAGDLPEANTQYHGEPTPATAKLAFFDMGQVRLELIEPDKGPSTWREFLDAHGPGLHHIAFNVGNMDEATARLQETGIPTVQTGDFPGGCYAYCDGTARLGAILELLARR
ncbi:MAG: VOC family protein [Chloroflexi bacterium]|nr:VOC family protein [Chloroflexota bacterium]